MFRHIPRDQNLYADKLANKAMNEKVDQGWCYHCGPTGKECSKHFN